MVPSVNLNVRVSMAGQGEPVYIRISTPNAEMQTSAENAEKTMRSKRRLPTSRLVVAISPDLVRNGGLNAEATRLFGFLRLLALLCASALGWLVGFRPITRKPLIAPQAVQNSEPASHFAQRLPASGRYWDTFGLAVVGDFQHAHLAAIDLRDGGAGNSRERPRARGVPISPAGRQALRRMRQRDRHQEGRRPVLHCLRGDRVLRVIGLHHDCLLPTPTQRHSKSHRTQRKPKLECEPHSA